MEQKLSEAAAAAAAAAEAVAAAEAAKAAAAAARAAAAAAEAAAEAAEAAAEAAMDLSPTSGSPLLLKSATEVTVTPPKVPADSLTLQRFQPQLFSSLSLEDDETPEEQNHTNATVSQDNSDIEVEEQR